MIGWLFVVRVGLVSVYHSYDIWSDDECVKYKE